MYCYFPVIRLVNFSWVAGPVYNSRIVIKTNFMEVLLAEMVTGSLPLSRPVIKN